MLPKQPVRTGAGEVTLTLEVVQISTKIPLCVVPPELVETCTTFLKKMVETCTTFYCPFTDAHAHGRRCVVFVARCLCCSTTQRTGRCCVQHLALCVCVDAQWLQVRGEFCDGIWLKYSTLIR